MNTWVLVLRDEWDSIEHVGCGAVLNKWDVEPALTALFKEVLNEQSTLFDESLMGEVGARCVTSGAMRSAIRAKVEPVACSDA